MIDSELRTLILKHRTRIKELMICDAHIELLGMAKNGIKSAELASLYGISVQNASGRLNKLFYKGYLKRIEELAPSGGIEYTYQTN